jgi:hypothetical protein
MVGKEGSARTSSSSISLMRAAVTRARLWGGSLLAVMRRSPR